MARFYFENTTSGETFELAGTPPFDVAGLLPDGTYTVSALSEAAASPIVISSGPVGAVAEDSMDAHWLLGPDTASLDDLKAGARLMPGPAGAGATFEANAVRIQGLGRGYLSDVPETADFTFCAVVQRSAVPSILGGTLTPQSGAPGWTVFTASTDDLTVTRNAGSSPVVDGAMPAGYVFVGVSLSAAGDCVYFRGDQAGSVVTSLSEARGALANAPHALGGVYYNSIFNNDFRCAELMLSTGFTPAVALENIYQRSITRMADRAITLI